MKIPPPHRRVKRFPPNAAARGNEPSIAERSLDSPFKSRVPDVFVFNPFTESYIDRGPAFYPTQPQAQLARDLANLPQYLCREDDIVLVEQQPSAEFLKGIKQAGFELPEFAVIGQQRSGFRKALAPLSERKLGRLRPWAWGPDSADLLEPLFDSLILERRTASGSFNPDIAQLYSKAWSAKLLRSWLDTLKKSPLLGSDPFAAEKRMSCLCTADDAGVAVENLSDALDVVAAIRRRGHHPVVVKQALGLAGSNALRLFEPKILEPQRRWMAKALEKGRQLVIEPWLDREFDFSVQVEMTTQGLKLCGYTGLINDLKGQFQANWAAPDYAKRIPSDFLKPFHGSDGSGDLWPNLYAEIFRALETEFRRVHYLGPAGIDAFVYRGPDGCPRLKPIVEINPRYTMGRVMVELMRRLCPGSRGMFRLIHRRQAETAGYRDFSEFSGALRERFPLRRDGEPMARIREGVVCLNDPERAQVCLAVLQAVPEEEDLDSLAAFMASSSSHRA